MDPGAFSTVSAVRVGWCKSCQQLDGDCFKKVGLGFASKQILVRSICGVKSKWDNIKIHDDRPDFSMI